MEKLIELLKEYIENYGNDAKVREEENYILDTWIEFVYWSRVYLYETIISKKFWFIKRLVENDKIDTSKAKDKNLNGYEIELRIRAVKELVADSEEKTVLYLNLLMILSISDTPIEDLLLYLKKKSEWQERNK